MKTIVGVVFAMFTLLNVYALWAAGLSGLFAQLTQGNAWFTVLGVDLLISLGLVAAWLVRDARARGVSPLPYLVMTLFTGSIGPLLYLLRRPSAVAR